MTYTEVKPILKKLQEHKSLSPSSEENPGELFMLSEYLYENKIQYSYGERDGDRAATRGNYYAGVASKNIDEVLEMMSGFYSIDLEPGVHYAFPNPIFDRKGGKKYLCHLDSLGKRVEGICASAYKKKKVLPSVIVDVKRFYPETIKSKDDLVLNLRNAEDFVRVFNGSSGGGYNEHVVQCGQCGHNFFHNSFGSKRFMERWKRFVLDKDSVCLDFICDNCGASTSSKVDLFHLTPWHIAPQMNNIETTFHLSPRISLVKRKSRGAGPVMHVKKATGDNTYSLKRTYTMTLFFRKQLLDLAGEMKLKVETIPGYGDSF